MNKAASPFRIQDTVVIACGDFPSVLSAHAVLDFSTGLGETSIISYNGGVGRQGGAGYGSLVLFLNQ